ncbi:hydroxychlorobactene glucoside lauroyltransferase CruD [Ignavibacteriales bacterium]
MIKANKKPWFDSLFTRYLDRLMRKHFSHFYIIGDFPSVPDEISVTLAPNHFSWWDGFFIQRLQREFLPNKNFHILMLSEQLKVYRFFNWMGAYGIDLNDTKSIIKTIKYTREILSRGENLTVIYPQGEIQPYDIRPLILKEGISKFVGGLGDSSCVIPVGFKVQYEEDKLPSLYCSAGKPLFASEVENDFKGFEAAFMGNLKNLDEKSAQKVFQKDLFK